AYSPHAPADNVALKVLTALDEKGPEAALALLNEAEAKARKAAEDVEKKKKS
ncbi:hypothetical protein INQ16_31420, partial [Escherichia coli]|nr:hypothetical protein [Escherichia coli]